MNLLTDEEKQQTNLQRFRDDRIASEDLRRFIEEYNFFPSDVRDYGEVPHYSAYFDEFDTTAHLILEPLINEHYPDEHPRSISGLVFNRGEYDINVNRLKLADVNPTLLSTLLAAIEGIIKKA